MPFVLEYESVWTGVAQSQDGGAFPHGLPNIGAKDAAGVQKVVG